MPRPNKENAAMIFITSLLSILALGFIVGGSVLLTGAALVVCIVKLASLGFRNHS